MLAWPEVPLRLRCILFTTVLVACEGGGKSVGPSGTDVDGDGVSVEDGDCDDADASVFPGQTEVCDGVDQDCDGEVDEDTTELWHPDADGDGFGDDLSPTEACSRPDGFVPNAGDCDDGRADVFPGALEVCDGVDTDCDGIPDPAACRPLWTAEARIDGEADGDRIGSALALAGDLDGDGQEDLVMGAPNADSGRGALWVARGPIQQGVTNVADTVELLVGATAGAALGHAVVGIPDISGDGLPDLAVGAWGDTTGGSAAGSVVLVSGAGTELLDAETEMLARFVGSAPADTAGIALAARGDLTGDGVPDLVIGAPGVSSVSPVAGAAYVVSAVAGASTTLDTVAVGVAGTAEGGFVGQQVATPGDLDGDGIDDLLVSAPGDDTAGTDAGALFGFHGPLTGWVAPDAAETSWFGETRGDQAGGSVGTPGDVNDDGYDDLVIGAAEQDRGGEAAGVVYVVYGPSSGAVTLERADAMLLGRQPGDRAGNSVSADADVDGDGRSDLLIGAYADDSSAINAGAAYLVLGPWSGTTYLTDAEGGFIGEVEADVAGWAVGLAADLDGSGVVDVVVGTPGHDGGGTDAGSVYLLWGEGLGL